MAKKSDKYDKDLEYDIDNDDLLDDLESDDNNKKKFIKKVKQYFFKNKIILIIVLLVLIMFIYKSISIVRSKIKENINLKQSVVSNNNDKKLKKSLNDKQILSILQPTQQKKQIYTTSTKKLQDNKIKNKLNLPDQSIASIKNELNNLKTEFTQIQQQESIKIVNLTKANQNLKKIIIGKDILEDKKMSKLYEMINSLAKRQNNTYAQLQHLDDNLKSMIHIMNSMTQHMQAISQEQQKQQQTKHKIKEAKLLALRQKLQYRVQAVVHGRAWLVSKGGEHITVTINDTIKGYGTVLAIDTYSGNVLTSSGVVIKYGMSEK